MRYDIPSTTTTVQQITQSVNQCLGRLLQKRQLDEAAHDDFQAARSMLEAMPLSTDQFDLACSRLKNAQHYLRVHRAGCGVVRAASVGQQPQERPVGGSRAASVISSKSPSGYRSSTLLAHRDVSHQATFLELEDSGHG